MAAGGWLMPAAIDGKRRIGAVSAGLAVGLRLGAFFHRHAEHEIGPRHVFLAIERCAFEAARVARPAPVAAGNPGHMNAKRLGDGFRRGYQARAFEFGGRRKAATARPRGWRCAGRRGRICP
jgi:hypothetical protein